ncbi:hypothetical protein LMIY3S_05938 [Labrys miyagiensis]
MKKARPAFAGRAFQFSRMVTDGVKAGERHPRK